MTTALIVLRSGWVIVGSLPTRDGTSATAQAGCLIVLNDRGQVIETFLGSDINGPWDMTAIPNALKRQTSAGTGLTVSANGAINIPLGLAVTPNGDITPNGDQVGVKTVEPTGAGSLFGLAIAPTNAGVYFVDDSTNTLNLLH